jgi:serine/threonine protein kinase
MPADPERTARAAPAAPEVIGRYALHGEMASGGMAVVHYGVLQGAMGFARPVAIKRILPTLTRDESVRAMFIDEARLAARIRHPNVVPVLDVVSHGGELLLVMEYVHGESLHQLLRTARARGTRVPLRIVLAIASAVLHGLHAAHEAVSEDGVPLGIVHRDVSPQNVIVGVDGVPRVLDFGIARAAVRVESTAHGVVKGKLAYMSPEQLAGGPLDRRADVWSAAVLVWEMLTGHRLFVNDDGGVVNIDKLLKAAVDPPSRIAPSTPRLLDAIVLHGLGRSPEQRFGTAREMAVALERAGDVARPSEVGEWVESLATDALAERAGRLKDIERTSSSMKAARARRSEPDDALPIPLTRSTSSDRPTARPPGTSSRGRAAPVITPHQAMAVPILVEAPRATSAWGVFFTTMVLGAGLVLSGLVLRGALGAAHGAPPSVCPDDMVRASGLCIEATESEAASTAAAVRACDERGRRLPTARERDTASHGPGAVPPSLPHAHGLGYRCVLAPPSPP